MTEYDMNSSDSLDNREAVDEYADKNAKNEDGIALSTAAKAFLSFAPGGGAIVEVINGVQAIRQSRQQRMLRAVVNQLGIDVAELSRKIANDEDLADLVMRGLEVAGKAQFVEKIALLSSIVAKSTTMRKGERTKARILTQALEKVEQEHIEIMLTIENWPITWTGNETTSEEEFTKQVCSRDNLASSLPHLAPVIRLLLNSLESQQLVVNTSENTWFSVSGGAHFDLTDLGRELLNRLREDTPT